MKTFCVSVAFVLAIASGHSAQQVADISGLWNRESGGGQISSRWGGRLQIDQSGGWISIKPESGKNERYKLDGTEAADVVEVQGCRAKIRITKATAEASRITITTWLVTKPACMHGEDEDDPRFPSLGAVPVGDVRGGPRRLETITDVYRNGNVLTVETTSSPTPGEPATTTSTYRK